MGDVTLNLLLLRHNSWEKVKSRLFNESIFWPDKTTMGVRQPLGGSIYWKKTLEKMFAFVLSKDEDMLKKDKAMLF